MPGRLGAHVRESEVVDSSSAAEVFVGHLSAVSGSLCSHIAIPAGSLCTATMHRILLEEHARKESHSAAATLGSNLGRSGWEWCGHR